MSSAGEVKKKGAEKAAEGGNGKVRKISYDFITGFRGQKVNPERESTGIHRY